MHSETCKKKTDRDEQDDQGQHQRQATERWEVSQDNSMLAQWITSLCQPGPEALQGSLSFLSVIRAYVTALLDFRHWQGWKRSGSRWRDACLPPRCHSGHAPPTPWLRRAALGQLSMDDDAWVFSAEVELIMVTGAVSPALRCWWKTPPCRRECGWWFGVSPGGLAPCGNRDRSGGLLLAPKTLAGHIGVLAFKFRAVVHNPQCVKWKRLEKC